jgi:hypothetical protein
MGWQSRVNGCFSLLCLLGWLDCFVALLLATTKREEPSQQQKNVCLAIARKGVMNYPLVTALKVAS